MSAKRKEPLMPPPLTLCVKLGSIAIHCEELLSDDGHAFDRAALQALLSDEQIVAWLALMDRQALLPRKRSAEEKSR